jgi:hypothetical protein
MSSAPAHRHKRHGQDHQRRHHEPRRARQRRALARGPRVDRGDRLRPAPFDITSGQALQAGLLDEIGADIVPVLLGGGAPYFEALGAPVDL